MAAGAAVGAGAGLGRELCEVAALVMRVLAVGALFVACGEWRTAGGVSLIECTSVAGPGWGLSGAWGGAWVASRGLAEPLGVWERNGRHASLSAGGRADAHWASLGGRSADLDRAVLWRGCGPSVIVCTEGTWAWLSRRLQTTEHADLRRGQHWHLCLALA